MLKNWTVFYLHPPGASLQVSLEAESETLFDNVDALIEALYIYNNKYGYPDVAIPGVPIRHEQELLFQDGLVYVLPQNTMFVKSGFSQYKNLLIEDTLKHHTLVFEDVM